MWEIQAVTAEIFVKRLSVPVDEAPGRPHLRLPALLQRQSKLYRRQKHPKEPNFGYRRSTLDGTRFGHVEPKRPATATDLFKMTKTPKEEEGEVLFCSSLVTLAIFNLRSFNSGF